MQRFAISLVSMALAFCLFFYASAASAEPADPALEMSLQSGTSEAAAIHCSIAEASVGRSTFQDENRAQVAQQCCKICRKGKACGNSCIKRSYTCRQPPGCACDG